MRINGKQWVLFMAFMIMFPTLCEAGTLYSSENRVQDTNCKQHSTGTFRCDKDTYTAEECKKMGYKYEKNPGDTAYTPYGEKFKLGRLGGG